MRSPLPLCAVVCLVLALAPCAHAPARLGLSLVVPPPARVVQLEARRAPVPRVTARTVALPAALAARFVAGAAPAVAPGPRPPERSPLDLAVRMTPRPLPLPAVAPGTSAVFSIDGTRRGWIAQLEGQPLPSPVYGDGKVMVGGGFSSHTFYGLDATTGRFVWSTEASDGGPSAGLIVEDKVLFNTESCTLFCVDARTGRLLWKRWLGDPVMGQPAAADGVVYSGHLVDQGGGYALSALRLTDGAPLWKRTLDADVLSAPVVVGRGAEASVYVTTMLGSVFRFRAGDGALLWRADVDATSAPWVEGPRVHLSRRLSDAKEQQLVLAAADGQVLAAGRPAPAPYARTRPDAGGVQAGWSYEGSRPVLAAGRAYYAMGPELRARDLTTGEEVWHRQVAQDGVARGLTPPAIAAGSLVVGTRSGDLYGIDIDTGMTTFAFRIGEPIAAQPVVAKGWVYCTTTSGSVVGLQVGDTGLDGWHMWGGSPSHTGPMPVTLETRPSAERRPGDPTEGSLRATIDGAPRVVAPRHTRIVAHISGVVARAALDQVFVNPTDHALDAAYLLPLPADAAVDDLEMVVGGRTVRARIQRRAEARQTFAVARARGQTASLLEEERPNLFQQRVANIPAHGEVRVRVQLATVLRATGDGAELALPLVAAPRYRPGGAPEPVPPTRPGDAVELRVELDAGTPLAEVGSPSHEVRVERPGPSRAVVTLVPRADLPNRDFVLRHRVAAPAARAAVLASRTGAEGVFTLLLHPPERSAPGSRAPRELIVLVDASSSMQGRPFALAQALARDAIATLDGRDTLRVVAFADRAQTMADAPLAGGPDAARRAARFLADTTPHGGTELAAAVRATLGAPADPTRLRVVLLLGDGNVGDDDAVLQLVAEGLGEARLHTVGLGAAPNRWLLEQAAELGRGTCAVVGLDESPADAGRRLAGALGGPVVTDLSIDWGGLPVRDVYPRLLPDLHAGEPLVVVGRYDGAGHGTVRLRGQSAGRPWTAEVAVTLPERDASHEALGSVWARRRVHELETAMGLRASAALREQIAQVGLAHGLVTSETSFVAVAPGPSAAPSPTPVAAPSAAAAPAEVSADAWGFSSEYWRDELGTYRAVADTSTPAGTYDFSDDLVRAELAWPEGEAMRSAGMLLMTRATAKLPSPHRPARPPRSDARLQEVFARIATELRTAYRAALGRDGRLEGRLVVEVTIRPEGSVAFAQVLSGTLHDTRLEEAILRAVRALDFGPGAAQTVEFPIDLSPAR